jgi:hypothetical protein
MGPETVGGEFKTMSRHSETKMAAIARATCEAGESAIMMCGGIWAGA